METSNHSSIHDNITIVHSGEDYFDRLKTLIREAKHEIHFQTYLFEFDETGLAIAQELITAAQRKVKVYLLLDAFGSYEISNSFIQNLRTYQIEVRFFSPWHSRNTLYLGRRLHHKIVVVDANSILIGGINISDKYHGTNTTPPWLDYAIQIKDLNIGCQIQELCNSIFFKKKKLNQTVISNSIDKTTENSIRVLRNDWLLAKNEIYSSYLEAIKGASEECLLVSSYFLPGSGLLRALKNASKRGVKISIILAGKSDLPLVMAATRYLYRLLLRHNIFIYEWKKSVLHGKLALVDNHWITLGSFNLNHLSSYGSIEMNVVLDSTELAKELSLHLESVKSSCEPITSVILSQKENLFIKFTHWLAFRIVRLLLLIATILPYKRVLHN